MRSTGQQYKAGTEGDQGGAAGDQGGTEGDQAGGIAGDQGGIAGEQGGTAGDHGGSAEDQGGTVGDQGGIAGDKYASGACFLTRSNGVRTRPDGMSDSISLKGIGINRLFICRVRPRHPRLRHPNFHTVHRYIITYRAQTNEPGPGVLVNVPSHRGSRARGGWGVGLVRMSCHEGP